MDGFAEVISRLRFSSDEGAKYSGDLLAIMEILKNTTDLYKGNSVKLSNADVEVKGGFLYSSFSSPVLFFGLTILSYCTCRTTSRPSATY